MFLLDINYADFVNLGYDLPVIKLSIRYHHPIKLGTKAIVKTSMEITGVRTNCYDTIVSSNGKQLFASAKVTLVSVDRKKG